MSGTHQPEPQSGPVDRISPDPESTVDHASGSPQEASTVAPETSAERPRSSGSRSEWPRVAGYEILDVLGRGGMGVVYKARQTTLKRLVALKMILAGGHASEQELVRFRIEAEAVARLQHPHIVQIYEISEQDGRPYLALEYVEGGSLDRKLHGEPQSIPWSARLVEMLARAIHEAHEKGIVHRDLKPANVLLTADGTPRITDFGLARLLDAQAGHTQSGAVMGTPSYMAPEQAGGQARTVGPAADVYALGAILYELLTGRPPFRGATTLDTLLQVTSEPPVPPSRVRPNLPADLETICLKCLEKEPSKRYASALALADELRRFVEGRPLQERRTRRWPIILRRLLRPVSTVVMAIGMALTAWAWATDPIVPNTYLYYLGRGQRRLTLETTLLPAYSPDGKLLAAVTADRQGVGLWDVSKSKKLDSVGGPAPYTAVAFAPDGAVLALGMEDGTIGLVEVETGRRLQTFPGPGRAVHSMTFLPDGQTLVTTTGKPSELPQRVEGIQLWNLATGRELARLDVTGLLSPDGGTLAELAKGRGLRLWDARTGQERCKIEGASDLSTLAFAPDGQLMVVAWKNRTAEVRDTASGQTRVRLARPGDVSAIAFAPDGRAFATAGENVVKVWETDSGQVRAALHEQAQGARPFAFSADGKELIVHLTWKNEVAKLVWWDPDTDEIRRPLLIGHSLLAVAPGGRTLATVRGEHEVTVWDWERLFRVTPSIGRILFSRGGLGVLCMMSGVCLVLTDTVLCRFVGFGPVSVLKGHARTVRAIAYAPDGRSFVSVGDDGSVRIWDAATSQNRAAWSWPAQLFTTVAYAPDNRLLATGTENGQVRLWDTMSQDERTTLRVDGIAAIAFAPAGRILASAGAELTLWDLTSGQKLLTRPVDQPVHSVTFAPNGKTLATGHVDGSVLLWDAGTGHRLLSLEGRGSVGAVSVAFTPDGRTLIAGYAGNRLQGGRLKLWDVASARERTSHTAPAKRGVLSAAVSSDGQTIVTGSNDGAIVFWDSRTGEPLPPLRRDNLRTEWARNRGIFGGLVALAREYVREKLATKAVRAVAFSPDGLTLVATRGRDLLVWDVTATRREAQLENHRRTTGLLAWLQ